MNDHLDRLLRAAALAPAPDAEPEPPLGLETRILAHWRETIRGEEAGAAVWSLVFRRALFFGGGVMLTSLLLNLGPLTRYREWTTPHAAEFSLADSAVHLAMNP